LAVRHKELVATYTLDALRALGGKSAPVVIDVKGFFTHAVLKSSGIQSWQL
jgi:hypothetical protein